MPWGGEGAAKEIQDAITALKELRTYGRPHRFTETALDLEQEKVGPGHPSMPQASVGDRAVKKICPNGV